MEDTPLEKVPGWTSRHVDRLRSAWITTAEQVAALAATSRGVGSLAEQLEVSEAEARQLADAARAALPAERRTELDTPVDTSNYGLGARRPRDDGPDDDQA